MKIEGWLLLDLFPSFQIKVYCAAWYIEQRYLSIAPKGCQHLVQGTIAWEPAQNGAVFTPCEPNM